MHNEIRQHTLATEQNFCPLVKGLKFQWTDKTGFGQNPWTDLAGIEVCGKFVDESNRTLFDQMIVDNGVVFPEFLDTYLRMTNSIISHYLLILVALPLCHHRRHLVQAEKQKSE